MVTSKSSTWFEAKVRVKRVGDDGPKYTATEAYAVDALSWGEAEKRVTEEMLAYAGTEFEITDIKKAVYGEIFFSEVAANGTSDKYYKCKLQFITIDENTAKEKRANVYYLVQAENIDKAKANIDEAMGGAMIDYEVVSVAETKLLDVFSYESPAASKTKPSANAGKAFKNLEDSVPDGQKVTISTGVGDNKIVIDKAKLLEKAYIQESDDRIETCQESEGGILQLGKF